MAVQRWVFEDPVTSETATFAINPNEAASPKFTKNMTYQNTSGEDGRTLAFEGRKAVEPLNFSGTLLTEDEYDFFLYWFDKRNQFYVTDDLDRTFTIYIVGVDYKRVRSAIHPWKHIYTINYIIIDWV